MPSASRPQSMAAYGVPAETDGMLPWSWAERRLAAAHNYWVATAGPHASPVWAVLRDDGLVFSCDPTSRKARDLARNPKIVVHLESGSEVVILEGTAEQIDPGDDVMAQYSAKYGPTEASVGNWYLVCPRRVLAWSQASYPRDATRFDF